MIIHIFTFSLLGENRDITKLLLVSTVATLALFWTSGDWSKSSGKRSRVKKVALLGHASHIGAK